MAGMGGSWLFHHSCSRERVVVVGIETRMTLVKAQALVRRKLVGVAHVDMRSRSVVVRVEKSTEKSTEKRVVVALFIHLST